MEGRNVVFEYRWAEGQPERFAVMAADLVRQPVEILPRPPAPRGRLRPHRGTGHDLPSPVSPGASAPGPKFAPERIRSHSRGLPRTVTGGIPMTVRAEEAYSLRSLSHCGERGRLGDELLGRLPLAGPLCAGGITDGLGPGQLSTRSFRSQLGYIALGFHLCFPGVRARD